MSKYLEPNAELPWNRDCLERFLESRWNVGGGFQEPNETTASLEATRFACEAAVHAGAQLPRERKYTTEWVMTLQTDDGGFRNTICDAVPTPSATYYAVRSLRALGAHDFLLRQRGRLLHWLATHSIRPEYQSVDELYYLVRAYGLLANPTECTHSKHWYIFLNSCRQPSGGFGNRPGDQPDIEHSYCATHLLLLLGLDHKAYDRDKRFAEECVQPTGAIAWSPRSDNRSLATLYWGIHLLMLVRGSYPWEKAAEVVRPFRQASGGFGARVATLWETYCAISSCMIAHGRMLDEYDREGVI